MCRVHGWRDFNLSNNNLELVPGEIIYKQNDIFTKICSCYVIVLLKIIIKTFFWFYFSCLDLINVQNLLINLLIIIKAIIKLANNHY